MNKYIILLFLIPNFLFANSFEQKTITRIYTDKSKTTVYYDTIRKKKNILMKSKEYIFLIREKSKNKKWVLISNMVSSYLNTRLYYIPEEKYVDFIGIHKNMLPVMIFFDEKGEYVGVNDYTDENAKYFYVANNSINKKFYLKDLEKKVIKFKSAQSVANE